MSHGHGWAEGVGLRRRGDLSTYYWPVLRERGTVGPDANADGGGRDGNVGDILTASSAEIVYRGNRT